MNTIQELDATAVIILAGYVEKVFRLNYVNAPELPFTSMVNQLLHSVWRNTVPPLAGMVLESYLDPIETKLRMTGDETVAFYTVMADMDQKSSRIPASVLLKLMFSNVFGRLKLLIGADQTSKFYLTYAQFSIDISIMSRPISITNNEDSNGQRNDGLPPNHPPRRVFAELQNVTLADVHPPRAPTPMPADIRVAETRMSLRRYIEGIREESGFRLLVSTNIVYSMIRFVCASCNNTSMSCEHARVIQYEIWMRSLNACNYLAPVADRLMAPEINPREAGADYTHGRYVEVPVFHFVGEPVTPSMLLDTTEDIRAETGFLGLISLQIRQRMAADLCSVCNRGPELCPVLRQQHFNVFMAEARLARPLPRFEPTPPFRPRPFWQPLRAPRRPFLLAQARQAPLPPAPQLISPAQIYADVGECRICWVTNEVPEDTATNEESEDVVTIEEIVFYHCPSCRGHPVACVPCIEDCHRRGLGCPQCRAPLITVVGARAPLEENPAIPLPQLDVILEQLEDDPMPGFRAVDMDDAFLENWWQNEIAPNIEEDAEEEE